MEQGTYLIVDYIVTINDIDETRQKVIYYDNEGRQILTERYYGSADEIRPGYEPA